MDKKIAAAYLGLILLLSFIVIETIPNITAPAIIYVDDEAGIGPGNPPEDYITIQEAVDAAQPGDTIFVYNGTYYENVEINKSINLTGESNTNTIINGSANDTAIHIYNVEYVNVNNFTLENATHGIWIEFAHNITISKCRITNNSNGMYIHASSNITINNNEIFKNFYFGPAPPLPYVGVGIYLVSTEKCNISNNNINSNTFIVYDPIEPIFLGGGGFGVKGKESNHTMIYDNDINRNYVYQGLAQGGRGIYLDSSHNNSLIKNRVTTNFHNIYLNKINHTILRFNKINNNSKPKHLNEFGIRIDYSFYNIVTENIVRNHNYIGIHIRDADSNYNQIINNEVSSCGSSAMSDSAGIYIGSSTNNAIRNNTLYNNQNGISLVTHWSYPFGYNLVDSNNITQSQDRGIYIHFYSTYNKIVNNSISDGVYGIQINARSDFNIITQNNISSNDYGAFIAGPSTTGWVDSFYNLFYHNDFYSNTNQAYEEDTGYNFWNGSYPIGGNFWSDYSGVDNFKGPEQNMPGSDGFGDTPYIIDSNSRDYYPLIEVGTYISLENSTILKQGWNLISIPLIQGNTSLKKVLEMIDGYYDAVQWYDPSDKNDPWKHYRPGKPFGNDLSHLNETMAFWIHITNPGDTIFLYNGTQPTSNQTIQLLEGWNMVGYPSLTIRNRTAGLNNLTFGSEVDAIWTFNAASQTWEEISGGDYFEVGRGYWIHATQECIWEVGV